MKLNSWSIKAMLYNINFGDYWGKPNFKLDLHHINSYKIFYLGQTKELIFSTTPNTGILTASNIFAAFWASARATFCGVVTMTLPEIREILHFGQKSLTWGACLWSKMPMFQRAGVWEGEGPLPLAFQCLILMIWRPCEINLFMISLVQWLKIPRI